MEAEPCHIVPKELRNVEIVPQRWKRGVEEALDSSEKYGWDLIVDEEELFSSRSFGFWDIFFRLSAILTKIV